MTPKVSYIVIAQNHEAMVGRAIQSILDQTVPTVEVIVIDLNSSDETISVVQGIGDPRVRVMGVPSGHNLVAAINEAVSGAAGDFVGFLAADEFFSQHKTEQQLAAFANDPSLQICGTWIEPIGRLGYRAEAPHAAELAFNQSFDLSSTPGWALKNNIARSSVLVRRDLFDAIGRLDTSLSDAWDLEFWVRAASRGCSLSLVHEKLTHHRAGGGPYFGVWQAPLTEVAFVLGKHILPMLNAEDESAFAAVAEWHTGHAKFSALPRAQQISLLTYLFGASAFESFKDFSNSLENGRLSRLESVIGPRLLSSQLRAKARVAEANKAVARLERARTDWFLPRIAHLQAIIRELEKASRDRASATEVDVDARVKQHLATIESLERGKAEWFVPRIEHLEKLEQELRTELQAAHAALAEYERGRVEWFNPRIEHLEGLERDLRSQLLAAIEAIAEHERGRREWYEPRIDHLESEARAYLASIATHEKAEESARSEIGRLEKSLAELAAQNDRSREELATLADLVAASDDIKRHAEQADAQLGAAVRSLALSSTIGRALLRATMSPAPAERFLVRAKGALRHLTTGAKSESIHRERVLQTFLRELVPALGIFDADWYRENNPDVAAAGLDPFEHYIQHGHREGRAPGPAATGDLATNFLVIGDWTPLLEQIELLIDAGGGREKSAEPS